MTDQADNTSTVNDAQDGYDVPSGGIAEKIAVLKAERPEALVAAAFVGGVVVAMFLKRLGGNR